MISRMTVNGRTTDACFSENNIEQIFLPLLRHLTDLRRERGRRILVMLAAPPAAGKSTLALYLQHLSECTPGLVRAAAVGMDGFHRYSHVLSEMRTCRDGREVTYTEIKGAPETFDLPRLEAALGHLMSEPSCYWPLYDRTVHDPVENALLIEEDIVILEGNYLLLDEPGWRDLHSAADHTIRIFADEADLRERLIQRKAASGISREEAERFVEFSDLWNVREVMCHFLPADLTLQLLPDGTYKILQESTRNERRADLV